MELEGYGWPTYNKLVHSSTTDVGVIHKLTVDNDNTCTPAVQNAENGVDWGG